MRITVKQLRRLMREALAEMKLGLDSAPARGFVGRDAVPASQPLGSPEEDVVAFQRDRKADADDEFWLDVAPDDLRFAAADTIHTRFSRKRNRRA